MNNRLFCKIAICIAGMVLASCSNESADIQTEEECFADSVSVRSSVDELYQTGAPAFYAQTDENNGPFLASGAYRTGMFTNENNCDVTDLDLQTHITDSLCQTAVEQATMLIHKIEQSGALPASLKTQISGEVRFLRAFNSFYMARTDSTNVKQNYLSAESDLKTAIEVLPEVCYGANDFHVTANSARMLLADMYLTMSGNQLEVNKYKEAASLIRSLVKNGKNTLTENDDFAENSAYNKLRTNATLPEYLFEFIGRRGISLSNYSLPARAKSWSEISVPSPCNAYKPTNSFLRLYDSGDLRTYDRQFFHTFYKYNRGNKTVVELFEPASWFWYQVGDSIGQHVSIYRYAEALLVGSEAIAMSEGVTDEAVEWLLSVRCRANNCINAVEEEKRLKALSREAFVEEIWVERYRELPFEMKIWQDVKRTGKLPYALENDKGVLFKDYDSVM